MRELITILPDQGYCENPRVREFELNEFQKDLSRSSRGWYMHGELEDDMRFDIADFVRVPTRHIREKVYYESGGDWSKPGMQWNEFVDDNKPMRPATWLEGCFPVRVIGTDKPCLGFFWTKRYYYVTLVNGEKYFTWEQFGLVCYADDTQAIMQAHDAMRERTCCL